MSSWQIEQEEKRKVRESQLLELLGKLEAPLAKDGFKVEFWQEVRDGELLQGEIRISDPELPMFLATIHAAHWRDLGRATFYVKECHTVVTEIKGYYGDGSSNWEHKDYKFCHKLTNDELENLGIEQINYERSVQQLNREFKIDKNIKLILNDILPSLKIYRELVTIACPRILAQIDKEESVFELQKRVAKKCNEMGGRHYIPQKQGDYNFTFPDHIGRISINSYGTIELEKKLTKEQLIELLGL